jgi:hypothetical protein
MPILAGGEVLCGEAYVPQLKPGSAYLSPPPEAL